MTITNDGNWSFVVARCKCGSRAKPRGIDVCGVGYGTAWCPECHVPREVVMKEPGSEPEPEPAPDPEPAPEE